MFIMPRVVNYEEDELLSSWILRLAKENAISKVFDFLNAYVYPNEVVSANFTMKTDFRTAFEYFWRALPHEIIDERTIFFDTSTFTGVAPFMTKEQRQRYINQAFNTNKSLEPLFPLPHGTADGMYLCPKCAKEELSKKGFYYLHRAHHLPSVVVCHKHGCPLHRISTKYSNMSISHVPQSEAVDVADRDKALEYAIFSKSFMDAKLDCTIDDIRRIIFDRTDDQDAQTIASEMQRSGYADLADKDILYLLKENIKSPYASAQSCLVMLLYLYGDISSIQKALSKGCETEEAFVKTAKEDGYRLIGEYRNDLVQLCHEKCGETFCTSPYGFEAGWKCLKCDSDTFLQDKYKEIIKYIGNGEFESLDAFNSMDDPVTLRHIKCGREFKIKARSFIYEGIRCDCHWRVGFEGVKKAVEQYEGFSLLQYEGIDKPLLIGHSCGNSFSFYYSKFIADPRCRRCQRKGHLAIKTTEDFKDDIRDLTGDEYSLVGDYNGPHEYLTIRHNSCNTVQKFRPYYFLDGARCKKCHTELTDDEFRDYVDRYTFGKYKITGKATNNRYSVFNSETKETVFLSKLKVLQELQRPTPSLLLPLDVKNTSATLRPSRTSDLLMGYLQSRYSNEPIFTEDIIFDGLSDTDKQTIMSNLAKSGRLRHIAEGVYGFPEIEYNTENIVITRYILRGGARIGFYRGESYAYEIGLADTKPKEWHIATNKESFRTPNRKTVFLGETVHIKGMPEQITDSNFLILETMDFLVQYRQCTGKGIDTVLECIRNHIRNYSNGEMIEYRVFEPYIENYKTANIRTQMRRLISKLCKEGGA